MSVNAGSLNDPSDIPGLAHFVEVIFNVDCFTLVAFVVYGYRNASRRKRVQSLFIPE